MRHGRQRQAGARSGRFARVTTGGLTGEPPSVAFRTQCLAGHATAISAGRGPPAASGERMIVSIALYWVVATLLTASWLWAVPKLFGIAVPVVDALIIAALCTAIAPLPRAGWVLATIIMALLIIRTTDANGWRETTLMVVGSSVIWLLLMAMFLS